MTGPIVPLEQDPRPLLERLRDAMAEGLPALRKRRTVAAPQAQRAADELETLGVLGVNAKSTDSELEDFVEQLWHAQDDLVEDGEREALQAILYCAGQQAIAYHRDRRAWIPKRTLPWRIRSHYNVLAKAVSVRVQRLADNKPMVSVQAKTADADDVERAEYKETLFWYLWERLELHRKILVARRWAAKAGSHFLKGGWDPDAGVAFPRTKKRAKFVTVPVTVPDPMTGQPVPQLDPMTGEPATTEEFDGLEEYFEGAGGEDLGPVELEEQDETGQPVKRRAPVPDGVEMITPGEVVVSTRSRFNIRFDPYVDDVADSWYVQDAEILPMSKIAAMHPDKLRELREAKPAGEEDKALRWTGLTPRLQELESGARAFAKTASADNTDHAQLDREYLYLETWIFPKNPLLKRLWGDRGIRLVTVGGILVERTPLPEWALKACPFVQIIDTLEEGNHYHRPVTRDLIPLQDDINRSRSARAERAMMLARMILWAPANHGANVKALGGLSGVLLTTRSAQHKPEPLNLGTADPGSRDFELDSLAAVRDLGDMNEASTGKLPSAGIAAKAIYALQYADEQSINEASSLQDLALKRLAELLDAITRTEYQEARKVQLVGADRAYMTEYEISPTDLQVDVDYTFTPGSMLARQKEAVKNELLTLMQHGLVDQATVKKHLSTSVPDVFRQSYALQEAKARRTLQRILRSSTPVAIQPMPFDDAAIHCAVIEEFALTAKWDLIGVAKQQQLTQLWQAYKQQQMMAAQQAAAAAAPPGAPPGAPPAGGPPIGGPKPFEAPAGAQQLEQRATAAMQPPG